MAYRSPMLGSNFRVLSERQCEQIHLASLEILARTGVRIFDPDTVRLLQEAGADVSDGNLVRIPAHLVQWALRAAPPAVTLHDRHGQPALRLQDRQVYFGTGSDCPFILDSFTGERRRFLKKDVEQGIKLCDALTNIDFVLSIGLVSDAHTSVSDIHQFEAMIANTIKPVVFTTHDEENCRTIIEMAKAVAGGSAQLERAANIAYFAEVDCPLKYAAETCKKIRLMAQNHLPVVMSAGPMMGATGPQTIAGILAQGNAESLVGNVIMQLQRQGAPFVYALGIHPLDMRTTVLPYGAPELSLTTAAATDLARFHGLPVWGYAGCSDAKVLDQQAAMEASMSVVMSLLTGNNLVHDVGYLESGLVSSFEMILLSDTAIEMGRAMLKPIVVDNETLALDLIHQVGQTGNYLEQDHTVRHFREVWYSTLIDRHNVEHWTAAGRLTLGERLNAKVKDILAKYEPEPLPDDVRAELRSMVANADRRAES